MTRETELFDLARSAFRATLPSEGEAHAAARRLERRLRDRARRRKLAPLLSVAFALVGALAYAAEAAHSSRAASAPVAPAPMSEPQTPRSTAVVTPPSPLNAAAAASAMPPPAATLEPPPRATAKREASARPAQRSASWAAVARSLARRDERAARLELERLSRHGNTRDRANAAVELARLAAHRGDCTRARKHLEHARASLGAAPSLTRAAEAVKRCETGASPGRRHVTD